METPTTAQEVHETLYDGSDFNVTYRDGRTEVVKVRKIPREEFAAYAGTLTNEEDECGAYVKGKGALWAAELSEESFDAVLEEGQRLNFPRFEKWLHRQGRRIGILKSQNALLATASELMKENPTLSMLLGSMNGS